MAECANHDVLRSIHPAVLAAISTIKSKFAGELTVSSLALATNVSPDHLIRLFRKETGVTPSQYLWNYRIERGVELLRNSGLTVSEIAYRIGFKSSYHFARAVKNSTGSTPTEVRKKNWNVK